MESPKITVLMDKFALAVRRGNLEVLQCLVEENEMGIKYDVDNAVITAANCGYFNIVKYLVELCGANPYKAICPALVFLHPDIAYYLIQRSYDSNISVNFEFQLAYASLYGDLEIIKFLVSLGANIHNECALRYATETANLQVIKYFVSQGVNIHACNGCVITRSVLFGHLEIVRYVISKRACTDADIDTHAIWNKAIQLAVSNKNMEIAYYLYEIGAELPLNSYKYADFTYFRSKFAKRVERTRIRAISKIYFWWIPKCHDMATPSGIRQAYRNLQAFEIMCM
jgi:hypothetical protein